MPYIIDEEERDAGEGQITTPGVTGGGGAPASNAPAAPKSSGSYVPLSKYLEANASKIPEFGAKVAGAVEAGGQGALGEQNKAAGEFGAKVSGGTPAFNEGLVKEAGTNPLGIVNDPSKLAAFREQQTAAYTGPTSWTGSNEAMQAATAQKKAVDYGKAFEDEAGRIEAVKAFQNPSAVTQGKAVLDSALLGMSPKGGLSAIQQQIAPVTSSLESYLAANAGNIAGQAGTGIQAGQTGAETIRGNVANTMGQASTDFSSRIQQQYQDALANAGAQNAALAQSVGGIIQGIPTSRPQFGNLGLTTDAGAAVQAGTFTPEQLAQLGITPEQFEAFQNELAAMGNYDPALITPAISAQGPYDTLKLDPQDFYLNPLTQGYAQEYFTGEKPSYEMFPSDTTDQQIIDYLNANNMWTTSGGKVMPDPASLLSSVDPSTLINPNTAASEQDYALQQALEQLSGANVGALDYAQQPFAGTAPAETSDFNIQALVDAINQAQTQASQNAYDSYQHYLNYVLG